MAKRILLTCLIVLVCVGIYYGYNRYQGKKEYIDGAVVCKEGCDTPEEKARFAKENSGDTSDGNSERKQQTASQEASVIAANSSAGTDPNSSNDPAQTRQTSNSDQVASVVAAPSQQPQTGGVESGYGVGNNTTTSNPTSSKTSTATENQAERRQPTMDPVAMSLPTSDSRSPNAPNELRFGGSGAYQWYRQGNLTWRIDTATGQSCIIYATMDEWQKRIVLSHGCGRNT